MNITNTIINNTVGFIPQEDCAEWCISQSITGFNNIEVGAVMFVAGALILLYVAEYFYHNEKLRENIPTIINLAEILLYIFFFVYVIVIRLRMYYYGI